MFHPKRFRFLLHVSLLTSTLLFIFGLTHASIAFAAPNPTLYCPPGQSNGGSGNSTEWVQAIQFRLNNLFETDGDLIHLGADRDMPLMTDGVFGDKTQTAVSDFQQDWNITGGGGAVGDRTWDAMGFCNNTTPHVPSLVADTPLLSPYTCPTVTLSQGGSNDPLWVKALQDLLNTNRYELGPSTDPNTHPPAPKAWTFPLSNGKADGSFGPETNNAVIDWQWGSHLNPQDGVVGPQTWNSLGMCY